MKFLLLILLSLTINAADIKIPCQRGQIAFQFGGGTDMLIYQKNSKIYVDLHRKVVVSSKDRRFYRFERIKYEEFAVVFVDCKRITRKQI